MAFSEEAEINRMITRLIGDPKSYLKALEVSRTATDKWVRDTNGMWRNSKGHLIGFNKEMDKLMGQAVMPANEGLRRQADLFEALHNEMLVARGMTAQFGNTVVLSQARVQQAINASTMNFGKYIATLRTAAVATANLVRQTIRFTALRLAGRGGAAFVGLAAGFTAAREFAAIEQGLAQIRGFSNLTRTEVEALGDTMRQTGKETGKSFSTMGDAAFFVASAGLSASEAIEALNLSIRASSVGLGDSADIARFVAASINAYSKENMTAARSLDILAAAVKQGNLEASQLAQVMGNLLPTASALGISLEHISGLMSVFSNAGADAFSAATSINAIMSTLLGTSREAAEVLEEAGLSLSRLREIASTGPRGLVTVMRLLDEVFKDNDEALRSIFGNVRAFRGVMNALAQDADKVNRALDEVNDSMGEFAKAEKEAADTVTRDVSKAWNQLVQLLGNLAETVGHLITLFGGLSFVELISELNELLVILNQVLKATKDLTFNVTSFENMIENFELLAKGLEKLGLGGMSFDMDQEFENYRKAREEAAAADAKNAEARAEEEKKLIELEKKRAEEQKKRIAQEKEAAEIKEKKDKAFQSIEDIIKDLHLDMSEFTELEKQMLKIGEAAGLVDFHPEKGRLGTADTVIGKGKFTDEFEKARKLARELEEERKKKKEDEEKAESERERIQSGIEDAAKRAQNMLKQQLDPIQKMKLEVAEINKLFELGALTRQEADSVTSKMMQDFAEAGGTVSRTAGQAQILGGGSGAAAADFRKAEQVQVRTEKGVWQVVQNTKVQIPLLKDIVDNVKDMVKRRPEVVKNLEQ